MTHDDPPDQPPPTLREEAAAWFAKMRSEDAAGHRAEFEAWLSRGALHRAAYNRIGEVFAAGKLLKPGDEGAEPEAPALSSHRVRAGIAGGLIASAIVGGVLWMRSDTKFVADHPGPQSARAAPNDLTIRSLVLPDGGKVILDVDGALTPDVARSPVARLERGRARFAGREPREVLAGGNHVRSSGGTFDLWLRPDGSLDTYVLAGSVQIRPAVADGGSLASARMIRVSAGHRYTIDRFGHGATGPASAVPEWPYGILEFRGARLADVIDEANRYSAIKIVLADPALGDRQISGRFAVDGALRLARRLALALSLDLDVTQPGSIILRARRNI